MRLCCATDSGGIAEQGDLATKPPNPLNALLIVDGGIKRINDIWDFLS